MMVTSRTYPESSTQHLHYNLSAVFHQKRPLLHKRQNFLRIFGILERFWRISDITKRILELLGGNSGKNFRPYFGNSCLRPHLASPQIEPKLFRSNIQPTELANEGRANNWDRNYSQLIDSKQHRLVSCFIIYRFHLFVKWGRYFSPFNVMKL